MSTCLAPVVVKNPDRILSSEFATNIFPCGKCPNCVKRRVQNWVFRLDKEREVSHTSVMLTLTYNDENLPWSPGGYPTLQKTDFQKFMKRLRKKITDSTKTTYVLKYYAVGEYGGNTHRPHYHAILFNTPRFLLDNPISLEIIWGLGNIHVDPCNNATIAYVAGYVMKKAKDYNAPKPDPLDDREPEKSLMSKGMGLNYLTDDVKAYYKRKMKPYLVLEGGQKQSMPRYFREKIFTEEERKIISQESLTHLENHPVFKDTREEHEYKKFQFFKAKLKAQQARNKN